MDGFQLGPVVLSAPRFYAGLALLVLVLLAELSARRSKAPAGAGGAAQSDAGWAWNAALIVFAGARLGFVVENAGHYLADPLAVFQVWQGGFSPWWGVAAGALYVIIRLLSGSVQLAQVIAPAAVALAVWLIVPATFARLDDRVIALPQGPQPLLTGGELDLTAQRDAPLVLNLWATWCGPCQRELPHLARAASDWPEVNIYYLNQGESVTAIERYLLDLPELDQEMVLLDPGQRTGRQLGSFGLPTTYFFAADGSHVHTHVGEISGPALNRQIERLIGQ